MIFTQTKLKGAYLIELEPIADDRGFFARSFCKHEFERQELNHKVAQCDISYNRKKATLRGMHYQATPHGEAKVVTCIAGSIYDVIIDLRPDSPTYCEWWAVELKACRPFDTTTFQMLYIPEGFAHGFQTLENDTQVFYQMSEFYAPEYSLGVRWNDTAFGVQWPLEQPILSVRDQSYASFSSQQNKP